MTLPPGRTPPVAVAAAPIFGAPICVGLARNPARRRHRGKIGHANILTAVMFPYGSYTPEATRGQSVASESYGPPKRNFRPVISGKNFGARSGLSIRVFVLGKPSTIRVLPLPGLLGSRSFPLRGTRRGLSGAPSPARLSGLRSSPRPCHGSPVAGPV
jgi:hypothetical protein